MVNNPFHSPLVFLASCTSTMDEAKKLLPAKSGTVVITDYQTEGRGRLPKRKWISTASENLIFTIIVNGLEMSVLSTITLRVGLQLAFAICSVVPQLKPILRIKWPNDIMVGDKKICGILCESSGSDVLIGIGVNVAQTDFGSLSSATSIVNQIANNNGVDNTNTDNTEIKFNILQKFLDNFFLEIQSDEPLQERLNNLLYKKDCAVCFMAGSAEAPVKVSGKLRGVNESGHIQIEDDECKIRSFAAGEMLMTRSP
ncbi:MAG: biotin--[acetyl-CoA-carboxylase] ligase [Termitinemataceae bacterium]|nr:MAG: biotin--[acetyl-CoA-carboxylase] ligase [Termitinemataceae bacterium]